MLLEYSPELFLCIFFSKSHNQKFTPKVGHFGFFQLIKNYAENTSLIDKKIYHKKPLTQPNKVLEELNLQKPV